MVLLFALLLGCGAFTESPSTSESNPDVDSLVVGLPNRPVDEVCTDSAPLPPEPADCSESVGDDDACVAHADCGDGVCVGTWTNSCYCIYDQCETSADCNDRPCACGSADPLNSPVHTCRDGCLSDDECESGLCLRNRVGCGTQFDAGSLYWGGYFCATDRDTCRSDGPCDASEGDFCTYSNHGAGKWECGKHYSASCD